MFLRFLVRVKDWFFNEWMVHLIPYKTSEPDAATHRNT